MCVSALSEFCVVGVLRFAELLFLCDSRKCSVSQTCASGTEDTEVFKMSRFFHPRWIFATLSTFPPFILLFFLLLFIIFFTKPTH